MRLCTLLLCELFSATSTRVRLLPRVDAEMDLQIPFDPKRLFAVGAPILLHPSVKGFVTGQMRLLTKPFIAVGALELTILLVHRISMVAESRIRLECFETRWALVDF